MTISQVPSFLCSDLQFGKPFQVPAADLLGPSGGSEPADQTGLLGAGGRCESPAALSHLRRPPAHPGRLRLRSAGCGR